MKMKSILLLTIMVIVTTITTTACQLRNKNFFPFENVQLIYIKTPELNHILSPEETEYLNLIWSTGRWKPGVTKTLCMYQFESEGNVIRYSHETGVFLDDTNQRYIFASEEQRDYINTHMIGIGDK